MFAVIFDIRWYWSNPTDDFIVLPRSIALAGLVAASVVFLFLAHRDARLIQLPAAIFRGHHVVKLGTVVALSVFGSILVATVTSPAIGFVGEPHRYDGAFLFVGSVLLFFAVASSAKQFERTAARAFSALMASALLLALWGMLESSGGNVWRAIGLAPLSVGRPAATMGHPSLLSAFVALGAASLLGAVVWKTTFVRASRLVAAGAALTVLSIAASVAGGRAAYLGLAIVVILSSLLFRSWPVQRSARALLHVTVVVGIFVGLSIGAVGRDSAVDLGQAVAGTDNSWNSRLNVFGVAARALAAQPLRPYGVGSFTTVSWEFATDEELRQMYTEFVPAAARNSVYRSGNALLFSDPQTGALRTIRAQYDKVHNYLLDFAIAFGIIPLLLFVAFVVAVAIDLIRARTATTLAAFYGLVMYAIFAQAWFATINLEPVVWAWLGVGWGASRRVLEERTE